MAGKWYKGHVGRFWVPEGYKNLEYTRQPLMDYEIKSWKDRGYDYVKSFSGSMYDNSKPMPDWVNRFEQIFNYKNLTYNFYKMSQLEIMPEHVDHFKTYMKLFDVKYEDAVRILVMLEDWKPGHYLEIAGEGFTNWIAGDYFVWDSDVPHAAANIGVEDRYTLQISGTKIHQTEVYTTLHWYNIPELETKKESLHTPQMAVFHEALNKTNPYFIYMYNSQLEGLKEINHSRDTIEKINEQGLDFYLYEPICSYLKGAKQLYPPFGTKHSMTFYSEFNYDQVQNRQNLRSEELDSILEYVNRNKLTNVTVYTCDRNIEQWYPYYQTKFKLATNDLFLNYFDLHEFEPLEDTDITSEFTKKFMCLNWRYAPHRQLTAAYLSNFNDVNLTWYFRSDLHNVNSEPWYNLAHWLQKKPKAFNDMITGMRNLNNKSPLYLDLDVQDSTAIVHKHLKRIFPLKTIYDHKTEKYGDNKDRLKKYYNDIFCDVVTESRFAQPTANFSEKTYRPMFYKKPFILVAPPHTLHWVKTNGFKTFGDFWDESYDTMEDHEQRLFAIFELLDDLNSKPIEYLRDLYEKMQPILEHNRKRLFENCPLRY